MEWINEKRTQIFKKLNKISKSILNYIYFYSGFELKYKQSTIPIKNKKKIVYYQEMNIFNIMLYIVTLVFFLSIVLLFLSSCKSISSETFFDVNRIKKYFNCDEFLILFISILLISISYIIGGPIRIICIIGFCILGGITMSKKQNYTKIKLLLTEKYNSLLLQNSP